VKPPLVAVTVLLALPCRVNCWLVEPTVRAALGVMVFRAVVLVMSLLAPFTAAPRLLLAPAAVVAPVPPLPNAKALLRVRPANVGLEVVAMFWMVLMVPVPLSWKLVALKVAIPLVEASALALLMVTVVPIPVLLARSKAPVKASRLLTPPAPVQVPHDGAEPVVASRHWPVVPAADTPTAPTPLP